MRNPSIHIDKVTFIEILRGVDISTQNGIDEFFKEARKYSLDNRSVSVTNNKLKKDTERIIQSKKGDTTMMADIIYSVRIKLKHRGIKKININDRDWLQVKQLTKLCNQFCIDFNLQKREGYIKYIEMGLSKISSMRAYISKLISMYESISREYESIQELYQDEAPQETLEMHNIFVNKIADKTGLFESFKDKPDKLYHFYKAKLLCESLGVDYQTFIDAQFDALDFCNGIPSPESLTTDKAKERLNRYLFTNNISVESQIKTGFWDKLRKR